MKKCISMALILMMLLTPFRTTVATYGMDTVRGVSHHSWTISIVGSEYDEWIPELLRIALMRTYMHRCTLCGEYYYTTERVAIYMSTMDTDLEYIERWEIIKEFL